MKRILSLVTILLTTAVNLLLATQITDTVIVYPSHYTEGKFISKNGSVSYSLPPYSLGRYFYTGDSSTVISRSYFVFNFSGILHAGSTVTQVNVVYSTDIGSYTFKITQLANIAGNDSTNYIAIGNGNTMNSGVSYGSNSPSNPIVSPNIKNIVPHSGYLYLGALGENETGNSSYSATASLTLYVIESYTAQTVSLTAENDAHGQHGDSIGVGAGVSATKHASPYGFTATEQQTVNLQAYDNQVFGSYTSLYNDVEAPNNRSEWTKTVGGVAHHYADPQSISYSANMNDNNGLFIDYLRYNYAMSRNDETEFDGTSFAGVVTHIVESNSGSIPAPSTKTVGSNNYNFAGWENGGNGVFSPTDNSLYPYPAMYKVTHKSNDASAFVNNSQKKLVRTPNGTNGFLHQVYTSLGHVWYEYSTDNGATWNNGNNGLSLDGGNGGKCPSIDWETQTNHVIIVWQEKSGNYSTIKYMTFFPNTNISYAPNSQVYPIYNEAVDLYSSKDANPNITIGLNGIWGLTIERQNPDPNNGILNGINFFFGESFNGNVLRANGVDITGAFALITQVSGTDANSINASFNVCKSQGSNDVFELAWEQYASGTQSSIKWLEMAEVSLGNNQYTLNPLALPPVNLSSYTSYAYNTLPSIISLPNGSARVCWIGDVNGLGATVNAVLLNPANHSIMMATGAKVKSVSMNSLDDGSKCYVVYSQNTFRTSWYDNARSSADNFGSTQLVEAGEYVQLSNGTSSSNIYVSSFYPFSTPYYFNTSVSLGSKGLGKTSGRQAAYGRGGIVVKDSLRFYYSFENLIVDNNSINFVDAPDKVNYNNLDTLNKAWLTQPFSITNKSAFSFTENSGFVDTIGAVKTLGSSGFIGFKIELLDNGTGRVLGSIKNNTFNSSNVHGDRVTPYLLKTNGIGSKMVRVRITMSSNIEKPTYTLLIKYPEADSTNGLQKTSVNELTLDEAGVVSEYALDQNYPNPFNPATTISYQLPKDGRVTIKVFDALGREVRTIVDEFKPSGQYTVKFDASRLSSGIYFYSIRSGDYNAVKKMSLIK